MPFRSKQCEAVRRNGLEPFLRSMGRDEPRELVVCQHTGLAESLFGCPQVSLACDHIGLAARQSGSKFGSRCFILVTLGNQRLGPLQRDSKIPKTGVAISDVEDRLAKRSEDSKRFKRGERNGIGLRAVRELTQSCWLVFSHQQHAKPERMLKAEARKLPSDGLPETPYPEVGFLHSGIV